MTEKNEKREMTEEKVTKKTELGEKESTAIVTAAIAFEEDAGSGYESGFYHASFRICRNQ